MNTHALPPPARLEDLEHGNPVNTPVDSIATVVMPTACNQSASACKSPLEVQKVRIGIGSLSEPTATTWCVAPISMPAACGLIVENGLTVDAWAAVPWTPPRNLPRQGRRTRTLSVALLRHDAQILAQPRQFLALFLHQPALAFRPLGSCLLDPEAEGRGRQVQLAGDGADRFALVEDQPYGAFLELFREPPAGSPAWLAWGHAGHRIHLSEDVHETGSTPRTLYLASASRFINRQPSS